MTLSEQAMGCIMVLLQKSLMEQADIVPMLGALNFRTAAPDSQELVVTNPPTSMMLAKQSADESLEALKKLAEEQK